MQITYKNSKPNEDMKNENRNQQIFDLINKINFSTK